MPNVERELLGESGHFVSQQHQARRVWRDDQPHVGLKRVAQSQVVLGVDVLDGAELVRQHVIALQKGGLRACQVARDSAVRRACFGGSFHVTAGWNQCLALEEIRKVGEQPLRVDAHGMAVFLQVARRNRDVLRPAGGAAGRSEHGRPLGSQQVGLASQHPLDVWAQCVVTGRRHATLEIAHRTGAGEAVLASVLRVAVAAHDVEQFALLAEHRLASRRLEPVGVAEPQ